MYVKVVFVWLIYLGSFLFDMFGFDWFLERDEYGINVFGVLIIVFCNY